MKGALVALTAYEHGGWAGVDALYRDPPSSTEQVLPPRPSCTRCAIGRAGSRWPRGADPELAGNVLGELQWKIYFELWKVPHAAEAAAGWGGDRYSVTRRRAGRLIGRIATIWDTPNDARQFAEAYAASLAARFPGGGAGQSATGITRPDGGRVFVRVAGDRVCPAPGSPSWLAIRSSAAAARRPRRSRWSARYARSARRAPTRERATAARSRDPADRR